MQINLEHVFPTPFWNTNIKDNLKDNNVYLENLVEECFKVKEKDKGRTRSNVGNTTYQSHDINFFKNAKSPFFSTGTMINNIVNHIYQSTWQGHVEIDNAWININKKHGQNRIHNHQALLSGCLYLKVPKNSGNFVIVRSFNEAYIYRMFGDLNKDTNNNVIYPDHAGQEISYEPKEGDLYVFPANLLHYVQPNKTDNERISISFNCLKTWK